MKKIFWIFPFILLLPVLCFGQMQEKIIDFPKINNPHNMLMIGNQKPVPTDEKSLEIVEIRVDGKIVKPGQSFTASDDWLKGLIIKLKNVSGKPILSIVMSFNIPEAKTERGATFTSVIRYGRLTNNDEGNIKEKMIMPDESVELAFTEKKYDLEKERWRVNTGKTVFNRIIIGSIRAKFEDGSWLISLKLPFAQ